LAQNRAEDLYILNKLAGEEFQAERSRPMPRGLHKTEIKSTAFIETFASINAEEVCLKF
jgi:hypothetical protein